MLLVFINFLISYMKKMVWLFELFQELKGSVCSPNLTHLNTLSVILQSFTSLFI